MAIRSSRVSSRKREMRPWAASVISGPSGSPSMPSGAASVPSTWISSRSMVTSAGPVNQASGSRPRSQPAISFVFVVMMSPSVQVVMK